MVNTTFPLHSLPVELIERVFSFLPGRDLVNMALTSKLYYYIAIGSLQGREVALMRSIVANNEIVDPILEKFIKGLQEVRPVPLKEYRIPFERRLQRVERNLVEALKKQTCVSLRKKITTASIGNRFQEATYLVLALEKKKSTYAPAMLNALYTKWSCRGAMRKAWMTARMPEQKIAVIERMFFSGEIRKSREYAIVFFRLRENDSVTTITIKLIDEALENGRFDMAKTLVGCLLDQGVSEGLYTETQRLIQVRELQAETQNPKKRVRY